MPKKSKIPKQIIGKFNKNLFDVLTAILAPASFTVSRGAVNTIRSIDRKLLNEKIDLLKTLTPELKGSATAIREAQKLIGRIVKASPAKAFELLIKDPTKFSEMLGKLTKQERKLLGERLVEAQTPEQGLLDTAILSSSWIASGTFELFPGQQAGELELTLKTGKSYIYPGVSIFTWEAMKQAQGQNGSGAGSVFWATFLRGYNRTRAKVRQAAIFGKAGI